MIARVPLLLIAAAAALVPTAPVLAQSSPAEPFAVTSRGRPAPRTERSVVVLRDSVAPRAAAPDTAALRRAATTAAATRATADTASARPATTAARPAAGSSTTARTVSTANRAAADSAAARARSAPATAPAATRTETAANRPASPPAAPPATARRADAPSSGARTHTIAWGDTWYTIAREYGVTQAALRAANPDVDPNRIVSGQVVRIPGAGAAATPSGGASRTSPAVSRAARRNHRVEPGESLWGIARRYGVSMDAIREANDIEDDRVRIGATLVIPAEER